MDSEIKSAAESVRERLEFRKRLKANANAEERERRTVRCASTATKYQVTRCFSKCDNNRKVNYKSVIKMAPKVEWAWRQRDLFECSSAEAILVATKYGDFVASPRGE
jgi:hypothetical protein